MSEENLGIDLEEAPQSRHRKRLAKEREQRKASAKPTEYWYEKCGTKLVKMTKVANGNKHSEFVCNINKKTKEQVEALLKQGKQTA